MGDDRIELESVVVVIDRDDPAFGEVGIVRNEWLKTFFPNRRVYSVELSGRFETFDREQIEPCVCPDCGAECDTMRPCPGCGLTIEQVVERSLAR
jgi:hypothetical protein